MDIIHFFINFSENFVVFGESVSLEVGNSDSNVSILLFYKYMTRGEGDSTWV